jgi:hypothetical protein
MTGSLLWLIRSATIAAIWERLADEHGAATAYPTLRTYVSSHRDSGA